MPTSCASRRFTAKKRGGGPRRLLALEKLLEDTPYADYEVAFTTTEDRSQVLDVRNLVVLSRYEIVEHQQ